MQNSLEHSPVFSGTMHAAHEIACCLDTLAAIGQDGVQQIVDVLSDPMIQLQIGSGSVGIVLIIEALRFKFEGRGLLAKLFPQYAASEDGEIEEERMRMRNVFAASTLTLGIGGMTGTAIIAGNWRFIASEVSLTTLSVWAQMRDISPEVFNRPIDALAHTFQRTRAEVEAAIPVVVTGGTMLALQLWVWWSTLHNGCPLLDLVV